VFAVLALINVQGVRAGTGLASLTATAKFSGLLLFVVLAARFVQSENLQWTWPTDSGNLGRATVLVIFALAGMEVPVCAGGEVRDPARTVPRALAGALILVVLLYLTVHLVAQGVLGRGLAASQAPLADALARIGPGGRGLLLATGAISMFGYLGGDMLGSSRILFAFGRDGLLPRQLAAVHPVTRAPHVAVLVHTVIAAGLAMTGTFTFLAPIATLTIVLLYIGCCAAAWVLVRSFAPLVAIPGLLWIMAQSTRVEFLAVGAVLAAGSALYWLRRPVRGGTQSVSSTAPARRRGDLGPGGRFVAACLAAVWLSAGLAAVVIGVWLRHAVLPVILGLLAIAYGWAWSRVAITGERQRWPFPLRRRSE
jgi:basic amino acid/polyamine antiporter, APA family